MYDTSKLRTAPFIGPKAALAMIQKPLASRTPTRTAPPPPPPRNPPPSKAAQAMPIANPMPRMASTPAAMKGPAPSGPMPAGGVPSTMMKKGGKVSSASKRADGIAQRGKTRGRII